MSENQYDAKLVDDGEQEADDQSLGAAEGFADEQQQRAQRAEQQRGLDGVGHGSLSLSDAPSSRSGSGPRRIIDRMLALSLLAARRWLRAAAPGTAAVSAARRRAGAAARDQPQPSPPAAAAPARQPSDAGRQRGRGPTEAMLGVPIYPGAQFIASYDAGRGQRYYHLRHRPRRSSIS